MSSTVKTAGARAGSMSRNDRQSGSTAVRTAAATLALVLSASLAFAQYSTSDRPSYRNPTGSEDPTDATVRHQKSTMGLTVDEWARHLDDTDAAGRLEAVKLLAESGDAKANAPLMRAVEDGDPRVASLAIDALGKKRVKEASDMLSERLVLSGVSAEQRTHILGALARIRDPGSAKSVVSFAESGSEPELRAMAIRLVGEIGDGSAVSDLQRMSEAERDPKMSALLRDAIARINARESADAPK